MAPVRPASQEPPLPCHLAWQQAEAQRGEATSPKLHSWGAAEGNLNLGISYGQAHALSISSTTRSADDTTLMAESEEERKSLLMKVKEESEKSWLKSQHSKT